jgi:hypothetical protein
LLKKYLFIFVLPGLLFFNKTHGQSLINNSTSLPFLGLTSYSTNQQDVFSFTHNQAALAQQKTKAVGVFSENRFALKALSNSIVALAIPTKNGNFGLQLNYAGFKNFNESKIGLAYAKTLSKKVDVGIQFNYYNLRVPTYAGASSINVDVGVLYQLSQKLKAGFQASNFVGSKLNKITNQKLLQRYTFGLGYDVSDNFFVGSAITKEEEKPINIVASLHYQFAQQFFAKAGFNSENTVVFAGLGLGWKNCKLSFSGSFHPQLGLSPGVSFLMNFKREE